MSAMVGGPKIPNFKVLKMLGQGSYGKVYKVQRLTDGQEYALKETDLAAMSQAERGDSVNEVRLLVSINHPNVIRYNEAFVVGNKLNVVMEYAPFGDLRYYITKGLKLRAPFPEEAIWRIFLQLCRGLEALHANNVVHRDIKPANIFLCQNDLLKIGDLGIAKALNRANFARTQIGTPCYMAPEVWSGKLYSYSTDLWSLGAVLYEMMTFRTPMEGKTMQELKTNIIRGNFTPIPIGRYSPDLITFCHSLLAVEPIRRPLPGAILQSSAASKWIRVLPIMEASQSRRSSEQSGSMPGSGRSVLLDTIVVPRDLRQLDKKLPPPSYDSDSPLPEPRVNPHKHQSNQPSENHPPGSHQHHQPQSSHAYAPPHHVHQQYQPFAAALQAASNASALAAAAAAAAQQRRLNPVSAMLPAIRPVSAGRGRSAVAAPIPSSAAALQPHVYQSRAASGSSSHQQMPLPPTIAAIYAKYNLAQARR